VQTTGLGRVNDDRRNVEYLGNALVAIESLLASTAAVLLENFTPVEIEEVALRWLEHSHVQRGSDMPPLHNHRIQLLGEQQVAVIRKGNVATLEEMGDVRGHQQPIGSIQLLGVVTLAPRLYMDSPQMTPIEHPCYATRVLVALDVFPVRALPLACSQQLRFLSGSNIGALLDRGFFSVLGKTSPDSIRNRPDDALELASEQPLKRAQHRRRHSRHL
jgi:hypothetical protein